MPHYKICSHAIEADISRREYTDDDAVAIYMLFAAELTSHESASSYTMLNSEPYASYGTPHAVVRAIRRRASATPKQRDNAYAIQIYRQAGRQTWRDTQAIRCLSVVAVATSVTEGALRYLLALGAVVINTC